MKKLYTVLAYAVMISQIFNIRLPILSSLIAGYSVKFLLFYAFIFVSLAILFLSLFIKKKILLSVLMAIFVVVPFLVGFANGYAFMDIVVDACLFLMPLSVFIFADTVELDLNRYLKIFSIVSIVGAVASVMVSLRMIPVDIWAAEDSLVRAAGAIESSMFLGGLVVFSVRLFVFPKAESRYLKLLYYLSWISCVIGIVFSQSRVRIFLMLIIILSFIVYSLFHKKSKRGALKIIALCAVVFAVVFVRYFDVAQQIISQVFDRFSQLQGDDINITTRSDEAYEQLSWFFESPIFGSGWGKRTELELYAHNLFVTLLGQTGIVCAICYICWLLYPLKQNYLNYKKYGLNTDNVTSMLLVITFLALGFTSAGVLQSGAYFSVLYAFIFIKNSENKFNFKVKKK